MNNYIILSEKKWNANLAAELTNLTGNNWILISEKKRFTEQELKKLKPKKIFIPHWSYIIPSIIYENFLCIVFHMTDLPYGRGGSPLQNLIVRGHKETKISALKVEKALDAGDIYLKKDLSLNGTARDIFERSNQIILEMIVEIVKKDLKAKKQKGEAYFFERRTPEMSSIQDLNNLEEIYDYIRMLDATGYPKAFLETKFCKFEFKNVSKNNDNTLEANVRIIKK